MKTNDVTLHDVDQLVALRASIADLRKQAEVIEKRIKANLGRDQVLEGALFKATLVFQIRETLIADKVREYLSPQQLFHATRTQEVASLKLTAKEKA